MKRALVLGGTGMLGRTFCHTLNGKYLTIPMGSKDANILDKECLIKVIQDVKPDVVLNCAAYANVDACETNWERAYATNAIGAGNVAYACQQTNTRLIHISTDYVFDDNATRPRNELDIPTGGRTIYGQSKWAGEELVRKICPRSAICRVSWLYGYGGPSFLHTILKLSDGGVGELKVVDDQVGNPTSAIEVSIRIGELMERQDVSGTFHLTCQGQATWAEFAREIFKLTGRTTKVIPCTTSEFPRPAPRPHDSRLESVRLNEYGITPMPHWKEALKEYIKIDAQTSFHPC